MQNSNTQTMENSTNNRQKFSSLLNVEVVTQSRNVKVHIKDRLLKSIQNEIELIKNRADLEIQLLSNGKKENRFWTINRENPSRLLVNLKLKGKIFNFGEEYNPSEPPYFSVDNDKDSLIDFLTNLKTELSKVSYSENGFWVLDTNQTNKQ